MLISILLINSSMGRSEIGGRAPALTITAKRLTRKASLSSAITPLTLHFSTNVNFTSARRTFFPIDEEVPYFL